VEGPLDRFRLDGRVALVCGGTGGIGLPICKAFAAVGATVAVVGRTAERVSRAAAEVAEDAIGIAADIVDKAEADRTVEETVERLGRIDVLVNSVGGGITERMSAAHDFPEDDWRLVMALNLDSALFPSQAAARAMIDAGHGGAILNVSSVRGELALRAGYSPYVASKAALNMLTKQHAVEWAPHGIRVNAISPTFTRTDQVAGMLADESFYQGLIARIPLGRIAEPDDLVGAVLYFCTDASAFVTGQILTMDGGLTACQ
jgi:NAD(P)-dependent dehydrogenase (short-subunit alcohol dehydrogenase family)